MDEKKDDSHLWYHRQFIRMHGYFLQQIEIEKKEACRLIDEKYKDIREISEAKCKIKQNELDIQHQEFVLQELESRQIKPEISEEYPVLS
jgi:hypothetical protein